MHEALQGSFQRTKRCWSRGGKLALLGSESRPSPRSDQALPVAGGVDNGWQREHHVPLVALNGCHVVQGIEASLELIG